MKRKKQVLRGCLLVLRRVAKALSSVCDLLSELDVDFIRSECRQAETLVSGVMGKIIIELDK